MKHPTRWIALGIGLVVVAFAVVLALQVGDDPRADTTKSALLGKPAPDFTVVTKDGTEVSLASLRGQPVIVNFWNSWCIPCEQELPALKAFHDRHAEDPQLAMVGIVRSESKKVAQKYAEEQGMDWTIAFDPDARAAIDFGTRGQPETFAIDASGRIAGTQIGPASLRDLETLYKAARGEPQ